MPAIHSLPVLMIARSGRCPHQSVQRGFLSWSSQPKSRFACLIRGSDLNRAELRRFYHGTSTAKYPRTANRPADRPVSQLNRSSTTKFVTFLNSSNSSLGGITVLKRVFSSGPSSGEKKNDDNSTEGAATNSSRPKKVKLLDRLPLPVHENIYTIPNILTFSRLAAAPLIGYFIVNQNPVLALSLFVYASVTDMVDGWIARKFHQQTVVGTVIDPMADKTLMTVGVVCLAMNSSIPVWLAGLILSRDVGLALAAIYYRWISLPPPKTMARYWDFSLPSAEVKPTTISKVNTVLQLGLLGSAMTIPVLPNAILSAWSIHEAMAGLQYLVALTTVWSGMSYIYSKDAVKILHKFEIDARVEKNKTDETAPGKKKE